MKSGFGRMREKEGFATPPSPQIAATLVKGGEECTDDVSDSSESFSGVGRIPLLGEST